MKQLIFIAAAAAILAGCRKSEAERFGYKGADLHDDDKMFFTTGPTVTNWLPPAAEYSGDKMDTARTSSFVSGSLQEGRTTAKANAITAVQAV